MLSSKHTSMAEHCSQFRASAFVVYYLGLLFKTTVISYSTLIHKYLSWWAAKWTIFCFSTLTAAEDDSRVPRSEFSTWHIACISQKIIFNGLSKFSEKSTRKICMVTIINRKKYFMYIWQWFNSIGTLKYLLWLIIL